jgi:hypothetical protein
MSIFARNDSEKLGFPVSVESPRVAIKSKE